MQGNQAAFWEAAAFACVALRQSDDTAWRAATKAWFTGGSDYRAASCQATEVRRTVDAIMKDATPESGRPNIDLAGPAEGYACPPTGMRISPESGPPGTLVTLSWDGAPWMSYAGTRVTFGDWTAMLGGAGPQQLDQFAMRVTSPSAGSGSPQVKLTLRDGREILFGRYTYS